MCRRTVGIIVFPLIVAANAGAVIADDISGLWKGRWTSAPTSQRREHGGTLRMRLRPKANQGATEVYRGVFAGRFAVVIPYVYRSDVYRNGNQLSATKRLGPFGEYHMNLYVNPHSRSINGGWVAGKHRGGIRLNR